MQINQDETKHSTQMIWYWYTKMVCLQCIRRNQDRYCYVVVLCNNTYPYQLISDKICYLFVKAGPTCRFLVYINSSFSFKIHKPFSYNQQLFLTSMVWTFQSSRKIGCSIQIRSTSKQSTSSFPCFISQEIHPSSRKQETEPMLSRATMSLQNRNTDNQ